MANRIWLTGGMAACAGLAGLSFALADAPSARPQGASVSIRARTGATRQLDLSGAPYRDSSGNVLIAPGEVITLRFDISGEHLSDPRVVAVDKDNREWLSNECMSGTLASMRERASQAKAAIPTGSPMTCATGATSPERLKGQPPGTVIVTYAQVNDGPDMVMRIDSNLPQVAKFDVRIELLEANGARLAYSDTCPVRPNIVTLEHWPYELGRIEIGKFRYIPAEMAGECR